MLTIFLRQCSSAVRCGGRREARTCSRMLITQPTLRSRDLAASGNVAAFNSALCDALAMELTISMLAKGEAALVEDVK